MRGVNDGPTKQADLPLDGTVSVLRLEGGTEGTTYWAEGLATYTTTHGTRTDIWRIYITVSRRTCE